MSNKGAVLFPPTYHSSMLLALYSTGTLRQSRFSHNTITRGSGQSQTIRQVLSLASLSGKAVMPSIFSIWFRNDGLPDIYLEFCFLNTSAENLCSVVSLLRNSSLL